MKKKELEILLQKVPNYKNPIPNLEQYLTPANIAADIIFYAFQLGDIKNKIILDLGCGTGIFSVGSFITGAKKVIGIDIDNSCIEIARKYALDNQYEISFYVKSIEKVNEKCDTILMNPPFGAQKSNINIDRVFIKKGLELSPVIYSLHLTKTLSFIRNLVEKNGGNIIFCKNYDFPIKWSFDFHKKSKINYEVSLLKIEKEK